ncbi:hypothetical protein B0T14DRAFT_467522 [Immersiella caudata]|uniref:Fucose-specific lectin n=1 Tax=Immersiella caudata TaxID=314043 RepID=A0AA39XHP5_9PEZI|nr:hypothetical protein B0T14DRAFT_467522 [Immersiella caudata]
MISHSYNSDTQPGLEVVQGAADGAEVVPQERGYDHQWPEVRDTSQNETKELLVVAKYPGPPAYPEVIKEHDDREQGSKKRRRRLWILIGALTGLVVVLAAALGGTLGARAAAGGSSADGSSAGATTANGTATSTATTPSNTQQRLQQIRQGSSLAVTGIRKLDGGLDAFLFYQDPQDEVRFSRCNAAPASAGDTKNCWDVPTTINTFARANAQLSASTILYGDKMNGQTQLVYSGDRNRYLSSNINEQYTPRFTDDSVNAKQYTMGPNSSLASYWPWTVYQDSADRLHHVRNLLLSGDAPQADWDNNVMEITALNGSRLAVVPMSTNMTRITQKGGYAVFYQNPQGRLSVSITSLDSPQLDPTYPLSWPTALPSIDLPQRAPIAALSVARPSDPRQRVDTHVWYLDASSNINVLYTDLSSGSPVWRSSQPAALRGADPDTSLACLNMATSPLAADGKPRLLELASADTKCYFQRGGLVMEARLDGGDWVVTGNVPIP